MLQLLDLFNIDERLQRPYTEGFHVKETAEAWQIEVDMPGVKKEDIAVQVSGATLEVKGERERAGRKVVYSERFKLPQSLASTEGIVASSEQGVLTVQVPKSLVGVSLKAIPIN